MTWLDTARKVMTPNYAPPPFTIERAQGCTIWDNDGTEYLDFGSGIAVNALGHAHPAVVEAVTTQVNAFSHTSNMYYHRPYIDLCAKICEHSFGNQVYLCNSGTEAIEAALKLARRYHYNRGDKERTEFISALNSFHGRTMGAITLTGQPNYQEGFGPLLPGVSHVPYGDIDALALKVTDKTAAVVLEPILGNGGVTLPPKDYFKKVRALCDERGALLIIDEIQTGVVRCGKWFAYEYEDVTPDLMTLAKGLGGGLPLGALVCGKNFGETLQVGTHASTFGGNPISCAAGLAVVHYAEDNNLLASTQHKGAQLLEQLRSLTHNTVVEVRGRGLILGVEIDGDAKTLHKNCLKQRLLTTVAGPNTLRLLPPLILSDDEIALGIQRLTAALNEL